jgi:hypothetical protein
MDPPTQARAPNLGPAAGRAGATIYVAAAPTARLAAVLTAPGRGLSLLVVPISELADGRPGGMRGRMLATLDVSGCRGFRLGVARERHRGAPESSSV